MKRHQTDVTSLVAGLLFLAVAGLSLLRSLTDVDVDAGVLVPVLLIAIGLIGLAAALPRPGRNAPTGELDASPGGFPGRADDGAAATGTRLDTAPHYSTPPNSATDGPTRSDSTPHDSTPSDSTPHDSDRHDTVVVERPDR